MSGLHRITGKRIDGEAHIAQSIADILTTPIGTRVMRRDYGSRLFELVDTPLTPSNRLLWIAATAGAIRRWEPRIALEKVAVELTKGGGAVLTLIGRRTDIPTRTPFTLDIPL
ncbi:MAG: GPW/gp25 family protein [Sphingobium sp.]